MVDYNPGTVIPTSTQKWYQWTAGNEYGYTTLLSCAGVHMSTKARIAIQDAFDQGVDYRIDVDLVHDADNEYDESAIMVVSTYGNLGYIPGKAGKYLNRKILEMIRVNNVRASVIDTLGPGSKAPGGRVIHHNVVIRIVTNKDEYDILDASITAMKI